MIQSKIEEKLFLGKALIVYGARQVGKTTLVREIEKKYSDDSLYLNCDEPDVKAALTNKTSTELANFIGTKKLVVIDEGQRVVNIGLTLKLIIDNLPEVQLLVTGSSSLDLSNKINEPLTGRIFEFFLPPLALRELSDNTTETNRLLETYMIYGLYPKIITDQKNAIANLKAIYKNYLYKDALEYQGLKNPEIIEKLLAALALQIGHEVSFTELASLLGVDKKTVATYIRLLELAFVVFRVGPYSRNLRKEINTTRKIYFWDIGVRNAIINNFNSLELRNDTGQIWENFVIAERLKKNGLEIMPPNYYFWRTWEQSEVDFVEDVNGKLSGFEIKWSKLPKNAPKVWTESYPHASWTPINKDNYFDFI